ncbi:LacI family transcriptional regulator, partial [Pseudomonas syringae pv. tagetis]
VLKAAEAVGYFSARLIGQRIKERRPTNRFGILLLGTAQAFYANLSHAIAEAAQRRIAANLTCLFDFVFDRCPGAIVT